MNDRIVCPVQALFGDLSPGTALQLLQDLFQLHSQGLIIGPLDRLFPDRPDIGQADAIGRQHPGMGVDNDPFHPQGIGQQTGVLATGTTEATEGVLADVITPLGGDLADGGGHILDRDLDIAVGDFGRRPLTAGSPCELFTQRRKTLLYDLDGQRLITGRAEYLGEVFRPDLAQEDITVGHRQRTAAAVTGWPRVGPGRVRADSHPLAIEVQDRATAGSDGMDMHHRCPQTHTGNLGLVAAFIFALVMRDVGRGPAHIETDEPVDPGLGASADGADDAPGRAGEDAVPALKGPGIGQPAAGLHEKQPGITQFRRYPIDILPQDRRQIGIDNGGVSATDQFHQRADLMGDRYLTEADPAGDRGHGTFVIVVAVTVHEDDRHRLDAVVIGLLQCLPGPVVVECRQDLAVGAEALDDLDYALIELFRHDDLAGENIRAVLVADTQGIGKALGNQQYRAGPLAFQQGVGGDGGPHLDAVDDLGRDGIIPADPKEIADTLERRIRIAPGIDRQQLVRDQHPVRPASDDIGKGAATVDPELPALSATDCGHDGSTPLVVILVPDAQIIVFRLDRLQVPPAYIWQEFLNGRSFLPPYMLDVIPRDPLPIRTALHTIKKIEFVVTAAARIRQYQKILLVWVLIHIQGEDCTEAVVGTLLHFPLTNGLFHRRHQPDRELHRRWYHS